MNYSYENEYLLVDIPNYNRALIKKSELLYIREEFRGIDGETYCNIHLKDGKILQYHVSMEKILENLKPQVF